MKRLSARELLAENPQVSPKDVEAAQRLQEQLKETGLDRARYRLATPLTGRRRSDTSAHTANPHSHVARKH
jgi:hypothetical protein